LKYKKHVLKEIEDLEKYVNLVDFGNLINTFEEVCLVDPLNALKSIEIAQY
jgi:hypothetical protein